MVMWIIVIALLIIGLTLFIAEVVFIPGTTVVGILGILFGAAGVIISFKHFGSDVGFYVLLSTLVITGIALFYSFKSGAWSKFSLKTSIKSKVNEGITTVLKTGDIGITRSSLKPSGNAEFDGKTFEVRTLGQYVEPNQKIRILQVDSTQIIVEPIEN